jgi:hypothetical protein
MLTRLGYAVDLAEDGRERSSWRCSGTTTWC